jgi:hypothetical protein
MSKLGTRLIKAAKEARAIARAENANGFVVHLTSFKGNDSVLLLLADQSTIGWLHDRLTEFATAHAKSLSLAFVIGDDNPVESDGKCVISVELNHQANGGQLVQESQTTFRWSLSSSLANRYRKRLSPMLESRSPCHQYLEFGTASEPVVVVSLDEYEVDTFRRPTV